MKESDSSPPWIIRNVLRLRPIEISCGIGIIIIGAAIGGKNMTGESANIPTWLIQSAFGAAGVILGGAITWGMLKERIRFIMNTISKHDRKIEALEGKAGNFVLSPNCIDYRQGCQANIIRSIDNLREEVSRSKEINTVQIEHIKEFIGYMKRFVDEKNGKLIGKTL